MVKEREVVRSDFPTSAAHDLTGRLPREERQKTPTVHARQRIKFAMYVFGMCFVVFGCRALELAVWNDQGSAVHYATKDGPIKRLDIVDRNGEVLATDIPLPTLFADARFDMESG